MKDLYIVGAGGFGSEIAWLVERINKREKIWNLKGFIDDNIEIGSSVEEEYQVLGGCKYLSKLNKKVWVICAIGAAKIRKKVVEELQKYSNISFATLIDPSAIKSPRISIGEGTIICAGTIITVDITIGKHVIINLDCTLGHNDNIGNYVTIYPSANLSGNVSVGECTELGTGMQIIQGKNIGKESKVGAGAVVIHDIPDKCTAVGSPAKPINFFE